MRLAGNIERMGWEERGIQGFCGGNLRERVHMENPGVDRRIILRWIFRKWDLGQDRSDSGQGHL